MVGERKINKACAFLGAKYIIGLVWFYPQNHRILELDDIFETY